MRKNFVLLFSALWIGTVLPASSLGAQAGSGQNTGVLKSIGFIKIENGLEVAVRIDGEFLHQTLVLSNPPRLVVDLAPVQKIEALPLYEVNEFGMTSIRSGQFTPFIGRIIFDFTGSVLAHEISKTESGLTIKFSAEEKKPEKITQPVEQKPVLEIPRAEKKGAEQVPEEEAGERPFEGFFNTTAGFSVGSYQIPADRFQEVYGGETELIYGLNLSRTLLAYKRLRLDISLEARTYSKTGASTLTQDEAKFSMTPISLAGRVLYQTKYIMPFVGFGKDWYSYKEESVLATTDGSASGWHYQVGAFLIIPNLDFLRIKLYYKFTKVTASENGIDVDLGGNEYGVGLSFGFNVLKKGVLIF